tara:strand:- start:26864 stop:27445 length:582 start_codon:yes stop_codon:yes gene_type:complete
MSTSRGLTTQNEVLLQNLKNFYENKEYLKKMISIINGESKISLRIVDWFVTNYAKKYFTVYEIKRLDGESERFKVYNDYKLKLKAYSKKRFDPFCRWERINFPYDERNFVETTIGQLNFFKWSLENNIIDFIEQNYDHIDADQNARNSTSKKRMHLNLESQDLGKTRKKREELSISATKCIKKENVKIMVKFS